MLRSWGFWHDKCAKAAVDIINKGGGIAGRKVELATEDTESNPAPGARKLRNLIQRSNAEFIVGLGAFRRDAGGAADRHRAQDDLFLDRRSDRSHRLEGHALLVPHRHRHLFDRRRQHALVRREPRQGLDDHLRRLRLGPEHHQESKLFIEKPGGKVLTSIPVPLDTKDFVPYLAQIPQDTEVLLPAFIGSLSVAFYTQAKSMGLDKKMKMFSSSASHRIDRSGRSSRARPKASTSSRTSRACSSTRTTSSIQGFNKLIGIDDVYCREIGGTRVMDKSHGWQCWEDMFAIKTAIEKSGYKTRKDSKARSRRSKAWQMKNSLGHPQGDKYPQGGPRRHHRLLHQPRGE